MKRKSSIGIIIVLILVGITFMIWSANKAKKKSASILEEFKTIDNSLKNSSDSIKKADDSLLLNLNNKLSK